MAEGPTQSGFPPGDPRNALYWENLGALEHQKTNTEAQDTRGREEAESQYKYGQGQLEKEEPVAIRNNSNRANSEGLLESGVLAGRQSRTQLGYSQKEHTLAEGRRKAIQQYNDRDRAAQEGYTTGVKKAQHGAEGEYLQRLEANPPPPPKYFTPSETQTPTGFVRVGTKAENEERKRREAAAKKVAA